MKFKLLIKKLSTVKITIFIVFLISLCISIPIIIRNVAILETNNMISGIITEKGEDYTEVLYYLDKVEYTERLYVISDSFHEGENINLYYFEGVIYCELELLVPLIIVTVLNVVFIIIFFVIHIVDLRHSLFLRDIQKYPRKTGRVVNIVMNKYLTVGKNGEGHPYYLICDVYYEGEKLRLKSGLFENYVSLEENCIVDVYFKNKKKYYIDLESYRKDIFY